MTKTLQANQIKGSFHLFKKKKTKKKNTDSGLCL
jgi:hypothetical protein